MLLKSYPMRRVTRFQVEGWFLVASGVAVLACGGLSPGCADPGGVSSIVDTDAGELPPTTDGGDVPPTPSVQPPINITWDLHCDPLPQSMGVEERRVMFRRQLTNAAWLLDLVEPYGARISFLAVGECYEFCVEESERDVCLPLLRRLEESGGILGTHAHAEYSQGPHDWATVPNAYTSPAEADVRRAWEGSKGFTDEAVRQALGLADPEALARVNTACESHLQLADATELMEEHGYTIREGGADQALARFFGHVPWNPYRPSGANPIAEDLTTRFVTIPQGMVIGQVGLHAGVWQDGSAARKEAELLALYATWIERARAGLPPKVWSFGWGVHTQDLDEGSPSRAAIEELVPWLYEHFVTRTTADGNSIARFASYVDVRDEYEAWEAASPGVSSFDYPTSSADYGLYPYLEHVNHYLRNARLEEQIEAPAGVELYGLAADGHPLLLAVSGGAAATVDASSLGVSTVRRVDVVTGETSEVSAASVGVGPHSAVLCAPDDCDAILGLETAPSMPDGGLPRPDGGLPRPDGGLPPRPDGGAPSCASSGMCPMGAVCCPAGLPCAGACVPDCRIDGGVPCPAAAPSCDLSTGLCRP